MMATTWPVLTSAALCAMAAFVISSPVRRRAPRRTSILTTVAQQVRALPRRRRRRAESRSAAIELVAAFAAELRAGQPVRQAFARAQRSNPTEVAAHAVAVAELGGDVPRVLHDESIRHELPILRSLAALWRVAEGSGAGLAEAADRLAIAEAAAQQARAEVAAQLAGPRATAKVLAGLPVVGVVLGSGLGASPVSWLVGSVWGLLVLVAGVALEVLGLWWIARLTKSVESLM